MDYSNESEIHADTKIGAGFFVRLTVIEYNFYSHRLICDCAYIDILICFQGFEEKKYLVTFYGKELLHYVYERFRV